MLCVETERALLSQELLENMQVTRVPGIGLFYSDTAHGVPAVFTHFLTHLPALPEVRMTSFSSSFKQTHPRIRFLICFGALSIGNLFVRMVYAKSEFRYREVLAVGHYSKGTECHRSSRGPKQLTVLSYQTCFSFLVVIKTLHHPTLATRLRFEDLASAIDRSNGNMRVLPLWTFACFVACRC